MITYLKKLIGGTKKTLPAPVKYTLVYKNRDGEVKIHTISPAIEQDETGFTAYSFGRGIRKFLNARVVSLQQEK
jgi:hypothetical protein